MTFKRYIRVEDEKGNELTRHSFAGTKDCRRLLMRYEESFKAGIEEGRIYFIVETELSESIDYRPS